jgi:hypothetical protein
MRDKKVRSELQWYPDNKTERLSFFLYLSRRMEQGSSAVMILILGKNRFDLRPGMSYLDGHVCLL